MSPAPAATMSRDGRPSTRSSGTWIHFNIHDCLGMRVEADAPTAALLTEMFAPFLTERLDRVDITVTARSAELREASTAEEEYRYTSKGVYMVESKVQIEIDGDGFRVSGTRELLTTVLPLVDSLLARRELAMIHAATFDYRGVGVAMPAAGGTGKTSTVAKLMRLEGVSFMGDDWAFISRDGRLLGYAKPMFIKPHHRLIYPHLFERRQKPLVPSSLSAPLAKLTTVVHPVVSQYPRLAGFSRKWSPEYVMVTPRKAFPTAAIKTSAPLHAVVLVERFDAAECTLEECDRRWMVSRLIGNFHGEITRHSQEVMTALGATGLLSLEETFTRKSSVLQAALSKAPTFVLRVPKAISADQASDRIVAALQDVLGRTLVGS